LKRRLAASFLEESFLLNIEENNPCIGGKKEGVINWKIETEKGEKSQSDIKLSRQRLPFGEKISLRHYY